MTEEKTEIEAPEFEWGGQSNRTTELEAPKLDGQNNRKVVVELTIESIVSFLPLIKEDSVEGVHDCLPLRVTVHKVVTVSHGTKTVGELVMGSMEELLSLVCNERKVDEELSGEAITFLQETDINFLDSFLLLESQRIPLTVGTPTNALPFETITVQLEGKARFLATNIFYPLVEKAIAELVTYASEFKSDSAASEFFQHCLTVVKAGNISAKYQRWKGVKNFCRQNHTMASPLWLRLSPLPRETTWRAKTEEVKSILIQKFRSRNDERQWLRMRLDGLAGNIGDDAYVPIVISPRVWNNTGATFGNDHVLHGR